MKIKIVNFIRKIVYKIDIWKWNLESVRETLLKTTQI